MRVDRRGVRAARIVSALLAFVLVGSFGLPVERVPGAAGAASPASGAADGGPVVPVGGGPGSRSDTGGSPGVLPPPSRIHVLVNRQVDGPGAPSYAAAVTMPAAAAVAGRAGRTRPVELSGGDEPRDGSSRERAPPLNAV